VYSLRPGLGVFVPDMVSDGVAYFFSVLFAFAGWHKLRAVPGTTDLIFKFAPVMGRHPTSALLVALAEIAISLVLLLPATRVAGLFAVALLLVFYAVLMEWYLFRSSRQLDCPCGGFGVSLRLAPILVMRNIFCAVIATAAMEPWVTATTMLPATGLTVFVASFLALLYLCSEQLIYNTRAIPGME
jgi:hypothetical protein